MEKFLPPIPSKRYFTISEVSALCGVKPHVLRYWEQEFTQLRPMKRRGNRRYYQRHEVLMIRKIRELLYGQGFTILGARNKLQEIFQVEPGAELDDLSVSAEVSSQGIGTMMKETDSSSVAFVFPLYEKSASILPASLEKLRQELIEIRELLAFRF